MSEDKSNKWELPEPVFRSSTGELVKPSEGITFDPEPDTLDPGFAEPNYVDPDADTLVPDLANESVDSSSDDALANLYTPPENAAEPSAPPAPSAASVEIEPQPLISEQFTAESIGVESIGTERSSGGVLRTAMLTIVFLLLLGVIGVVIALTYFYYFAGRQSSGGF